MPYRSNQPVARASRASVGVAEPSVTAYQRPGKARETGVTGRAGRGRLTLKRELLRGARRGDAPASNARIGAIEAGATSPTAAAHHRSSASPGATRPSPSPAAKAETSSSAASEGGGTRSRSSAATKVSDGSGPEPRSRISASPSASSWSRWEG